MEKLRISILGCGWFGLPLAKALVLKGHHIKGSTTSVSKLNLLSEAGITPYIINAAAEIFDESFFNCDLLIISIPPKTNSDQLLYELKIGKLAAAAMHAGCKQILLISSTGIYQDGNFIVDERIIPEPNTPVGMSLKEAEEILKSTKSFTTTIIRFAGLIGPERNLAKHFAGKTEIANGQAPINLIHLNDCIGITSAIIDQQAFGKTYHAVSPNHPTREEFYSLACKASGLAKPYFKDELLNWKQVDSINVKEYLKYHYLHKDWSNYFYELERTGL